MKVIINFLIAIAIATCEVVPPYPARGLRPSPPFNLPIRTGASQIRQPHTTYGVPNPTPPVPPSPQIQYGLPNNPSPNLSPSFSSKQTVPRTSYGVPITESAGSSRNTFRIVNSQPQTTYGVPNRPDVVNQPQTQYGAPDVETLEQILQLTNLLQQSRRSKLAQRNQFASQSQNFNGNGIPSTQYLPQREADNFRASFEQSNFNNLQSQTSNGNIGRPAAQYLPANEAGRFQNSNQYQQQQQQQQQILQQLSQQYLPVKEPTSFRKDFELPVTAVPPRSFPNTNFGILPSRSEPNLPTNGISTQQPQPNIPSSQYVPSANNPAVPEPDRFPANSNQQISQTGFQQPTLNGPENPNLTPTNFGRVNPQTNFDIQEADVRKLNPSNANKNTNRFESPGQNLRPTARPVNQNRGLEGIKPEATSARAEETYLPPATTARTINRQINRPNFASTTTETPFEGSDESTEPDEESAGPNIAIATAVSGAPGGQSFYLLQPDGRLQRVVYQKSREEGDHDNEYTANYLFQNIQPEPNLVYSPLIALGK